MVGISGVFCMQNSRVKYVGSVDVVGLNSSVFVAPTNLYFLLYVNLLLSKSSLSAPTISIFANFSPKSSFLTYSFKDGSVERLYSKSNIESINVACEGTT